MSPRDPLAAIGATFRSDLLAGRSALVVGGTSGIGAAIGNALARLGATVGVSGASAAEVTAARRGRLPGPGSGAARRARRCGHRPRHRRDAAPLMHGVA